MPSILDTAKKRSYVERMAIATTFPRPFRRLYKGSAHKISAYSCFEKRLRKVDGHMDLTNRKSSKTDPSLQYYHADWLDNVQHLYHPLF